MRYLVTASEMKQYDQNTIERMGIPGMVLMERAALGSFYALQERGRIRKGGRVYILAGYGNNGGDGLALARLLSEAGMEIEIGCFGDPQRATGQWISQAGILKSFPVKLGREPGRDAYDIIVDALFGVGLSRELKGEYAQIVERINSLSGYKLALDLPSGISADNGRILGVAFKADLTVTFGFEKRGLYLFPGCQYTGEVKTVDVGIGERAFYGRSPGMFYNEDSLEELLPRRAPAGNKGSFGKVLLLAGSCKMAGAAVLCCSACYRTGAGMVRVITDGENRVILQQTVPEALFGTYEDLEKSRGWCDVICIGPGLGRGRAGLEALRTLLCGASQEPPGEVPLLIDADGINLLAEHEEVLRGLREQTGRGRQVVLTPHVGELSRLYGAVFGRENTPGMPELKQELAGYAAKLAKELHAVVVAKDARTCIAGAEGPVCLNLAGNSGMATAGSGDVLAGMITALMAQGMPVFEAACKGVRLHALAGDLAAGHYGEHAVMARDLYEELR